MIVDRRIAPSRPPAWEKVALVHELAAEPGVVLWIDADALVRDHAPDVEASLDPTRFLHLVEHRMNGMRVPNTGVMAVRGGPRATAFFERVWRVTDDVNHRWWENAAILRLLGYRLQSPVWPTRVSPWRRHVGFLGGAWNSIPADPAPDPYVVHFPGWPLGDRLDALRRVSRTEYV